MIFFIPIIVKYVEKNLDLTKARFTVKLKITKAKGLAKRHRYNEVSLCRAFYL